MKTCTSAPAPSEEEALVGAAVALLIVGVAVILGGCITLSNPVLNTGAVASANHQISLTMTASADLGSGRGVIAIRVPGAWEVKSVNLTGSMAGAVTRSLAMEAHYVSSWESQTGAGFNGPKPGYRWWWLPPRCPGPMEM